MPSYEFSACPACGAGDAALIASRADIVRELEALWEHYSTPPIPLPALADRLSFTHDPPLAVVRCRSCGLLYRNPRERDVRALYEREAVDASRIGELDALQRPVFQALARRLTEMHGGTGRGLEVGCYSGGFLAAAGEAGWAFRGLDVNPATVELARRRGLDAAVGSIEDTPPAAAYDVVAFWNCFDQLPDPPGAARAAHQRLRAGGIIAIRVPNGGFYAALRPRLAGPLAGPARALLARHNLLGFPYRHGFTRRSLDRLLRACGFEPTANRAAGVLPASGTPSRERLLDGLEYALRPLTGPAWLEVYARRR